MINYRLILFLIILMLIVGYTDARTTTTHMRYTIGSSLYDAESSTWVVSPSILSLISHPSNPNVFVSSQSWENGNNIGEFSIIQDPNNSNIVDIWYSGGGGYPQVRSVGYASSSDSNVQVWTKYPSNPVSLGKNIGEPYVMYDPTSAKYYLFGIDSWRNESGNQGNGNGYLYLWNSSDKITWQIMNGGNPVMIPSNIGSNVNYRFWNVAIQPVIVSGTTYFVMFFDGGNINEPLPTGNYHVAFTYSTLSELNWSAHVVNSEAFSNGAATMDFKYVPERNAYLFILPRWETDRYQTYVAFADATNPLAPTNYKRNPTRILSGAASIEADPSFIFLTNKSKAMVAMFTYGQGIALSEYYGSQSLLDFYDSYYDGAV